jgi:uncharacterized membrane protein YgcG
VLAAFQARTGRDLMVVSVPKVERMGGSDFAAALLRRFGLGDRPGQDGALLLVVTSSRDAHVARSFTLDRVLPRAALAAVVKDRMQPYVSGADWSAAVDNGVGWLMARMEGTDPPAVRSLPQAAAPASPAATQPAAATGHARMIGWAVGVGVVGGAMLLALRARHGVCPQCGARAVREEVRVLREPTLDRAGTAQTTRRCPRCGWSRAEESALPVRRNVVLADARAAGTDRDPDTAISDHPTVPGANPADDEVTDARGQGLVVDEREG